MLLHMKNSEAAIEAGTEASRVRALSLYINNGGQCAWEKRAGERIKS